jgi:hypothetical protein
MKNLKKWLLTFMAAFMLVGVATGCTGEDTETEDTEMEQTETEGTETEGTETEGTETEGTETEEEAQ